MRSRATDTKIRGQGKVKALNWMEADMFTEENS